MRRRVLMANLKRALLTKDFYLADRCVFIIQEMNRRRNVKWGGKCREGLNGVEGFALLTLVRIIALRDADSQWMWELLGLADRDEETARKLAREHPRRGANRNSDKKEAQTASIRERDSATI